MKTFMKIMGIAALMTGMTTGAMAQEQTHETEKPGFFKQAFRDMKESAKRQREIDKANFKAQKMKTKAFYQEQKAKRNPEVRKMVQKQAYQPLGLSSYHSSFSGFLYPHATARLLLPYSYERYGGKR